MAPQMFWHCTGCTASEMAHGCTLWRARLREWLTRRCALSRRQRLGIWQTARRDCLHSSSAARGPRSRLPASLWRPARLGWDAAAGSWAAGGRKAQRRRSQQRQLCGFQRQRIYRRRSFRRRRRRRQQQQQRRRGRKRSRVLPAGVPAAAPGAAPQLLHARHPARHQHLRGPPGEHLVNHQPS